VRVALSVVWYAVVERAVVEKAVDFAVGYGVVYG